MKRYRYELMTLHLDNHLAWALLDEHGQQGWRVISAHFVPNVTTPTHASGPAFWMILELVTEDASGQGSA